MALVLDDAPVGGVAERGFEQRIDDGGCDREVRGLVLAGAGPGVAVGKTRRIGQQIDRAARDRRLDVLRDLPDADDDGRTRIDHGMTLSRGSYGSVASTGHAGSPRATLSRQIDRYAQCEHSAAS